MVVRGVAKWFELDGTNICPFSKPIVHPSLQRPLLEHGPPIDFKVVAGWLVRQAVNKKDKELSELLLSYNKSLDWASASSPRFDPAFMAWLLVTTPEHHPARPELLELCYESEGFAIHAFHTSKSN